MTESQNTLLADAEAYVADFFQQHISAEYVFHDFQHTCNVVESVIELSSEYDLSNREKTILELAAWFHDTGYKESYAGHEERSCKYATAFLENYNFPPEDLKLLTESIMATRVPQNPKSLIGEILCDADLGHLGKKIYWDRCGRLRQELLITRSMVMSEQEWIDFEISFMTLHHYHTNAAQELYGKRKRKHIKQLKKQRDRLHPTIDSVELLAERDKNKKKKKKRPNWAKTIKKTDNEIKDMRLGRGVETMYRTTYRTHVNLSSIADNKANIMLSINAIVISIVLGTLVPSIDTDTHLLIPTLILLGVCLVAMVFAILSTRPKITEGKFTREDIENKTSNLLFFGNFYNMKLEDFHWGMKEMIKDSDFLYSSMTRDLFYLGIVLAKKYRYLSICYNVFMYGLIFSVIAFAVAFVANT